MNKKLTIHLVEDDMIEVMKYKRTISKLQENHNLIEAKNGEEALSILKNGNLPDIILLDLNMPRKDGREVLDEIKKNETLRKIPVVVLTTSKAETDINHAYDLGVNSYIQKPVRFNEFVEVIKVLSHYWFQIVKLPE